MSRFIRRSITVPQAVELSITDDAISAKGAFGSVHRSIAQSLVALDYADGVVSIRLKKDDPSARAMAGTYWQLVNNLIHGAHVGFEKILDIVGIGYRAQLQGNTISLSLGFSHPVSHQLPAGISATINTPTEIIIRGADKHLVGQVASDIRSYRPVERYKGKGVRYRGERVILKETKKK